MLKPIENKIIPVLVLNDMESAKRIADIALNTNHPALEITLRTDNSLDIIANLNDLYGADLLLIAGTVMNKAQAKAALSAGSSYLVSPGITPQLINDLRPYHDRWFGGVSTISEAMMMAENNIPHAKFFPALLNGGIAWLNSVAAVMPSMSFFPTGGINLDNAATFLAQKNVVHVGGTWLASQSLIASGDFAQIQENFNQIKDLNI